MPDNLKPLGQCNALKLNNAQFDSDFESLHAKLLIAMDIAGVPGAQMRNCSACKSRVPQAAVKCPKCGHLRKDIEMLRALSYGATGLGLSLVFLNALYKDVHPTGQLLVSVIAVVLCMIGVGFAIIIKKVTGGWW